MANGYDTGGPALADVWGSPTKTLAAGGTEGVWPAAGDAGANGGARTYAFYARDMDPGDTAFVGAGGADGGYGVDAGYGGGPGGDGGLGGGMLYFAAAVSSLVRPLTLSAKGLSGSGGEAGPSGGDGSGGGGGGGSGGVVVDLRIDSTAVANLTLTATGGAGGVGWTSGPGGDGGDGGSGATGLTIQGA